MLSGLALGRTVLEIGTGLGVSTRALAETASRVFTVDVDPWVAEAIAPSLPANVTFLRETGEFPATARCSMAFIDGLHKTEAVVQDVRFALARLERPGLLVFHDGRMAPVQEGIRRSGLDLSGAYPLQTEAGLVLVFVGAKK